MTRRAKWIAALVTLAVVGVSSSIALAKPPVVRLQVSRNAVSQGCSLEILAHGDLPKSEEVAGRVPLRLLVAYAPAREIGTGQKCPESVYELGHSYLDFNRQVDYGLFVESRVIRINKTTVKGAWRACAYLYDSVGGRGNLGGANHPFASAEATWHVT
jgi:hypothetical protein